MACSADLGRTIHTSGLLIRANCMRRMHHVQGEADDVTGLLIAALAASIHANRPVARSADLGRTCQRSQRLPCGMRCSGSCSRADGAASGITAALVLMEAARLPPG